MSIRADILTCTKCELQESCTSPVPFSGPYPNPFVVIGEAPGQQEDAQMLPFIGPAGQLLRQALDIAYGEEGFADCLSYLNAVCCWPKLVHNPRNSHIEACYSNLLAQLNILEPRFALVVGGTALNALHPRRKASLSISQYRGTWIGLRGSWGRTLALATWHPSAVLRRGGLGTALGKEFMEDLASYVDSVLKFV